MARLTFLRAVTSLGQKNSLFPAFSNGGIRNNATTAGSKNTKGRGVHQEAHKTSSNIEPGVLFSPLGSVEVPKIDLVNYVFENYQKYADKSALTCASSGRSYNFGMTRSLITRFAQALIAKCGLQPREVVALLLPNMPEYVIAIHGVMEAGLVATFVNPLYTPDEIKRQFQNAGVKAIITIPQLLEVATTVGPQLPEYRTTVCIGGPDDPIKNVHSFQTLLSAGHKADLPGINPNEIAALPYSSGTTGLPKGVQLTHYSLVANLEQGNHPELLTHTPTTNTYQEVILTVLPYFHIYGFNGIMNISLYHGLHLISLPKFTPEEYIKALVQYRPTSLFVVPSLLLFLASHPAVTKDHLASIKSVMSGAAPASEGLMQKFKEKVGKDDIVLRQGYGMTESAPVTLILPRKVPPSKLGSAGVLYPGTEGKVVSLTTGEAVGPYKTGELWVRGPQVMAGYLNNEAATAETLDENGWLHTGDVAYYDDDQYFYIVDRTKELIKVKGNQVSPTELENIILELPQVADVAVVGVPDALAGEVPKAFVVLKPGTKLSEEDVLLHVNPKVTGYKKLAGGARFIEAIPRNAAGKVLRNELKVLGGKMSK